MTCSNYDLLKSSQAVAARKVVESHDPVLRDPDLSVGDRAPHGFAEYAPEFQLSGWPQLFPDGAPRQAPLARESRHDSRLSPAKWRDLTSGLARSASRPSL